MPFPRISLVALATSAVLVAAPGLPASAQTPDGGEAPGVERSFGPDRVTTAVAASSDHRAGATDALLANAGAFPDALAAGALAGKLDAPVLLTPAAALPDSVDAELARLGVRTVWILGGERAVSSAVEQHLAARGYAVQRIAGDSRYATAGEAAEAAGPASTREVVLALGEHRDRSRAWPDAVAAGALAASPDRVPTLLTRQHELPAETEQALADLATTKVWLLGGTGTIAPAVEERLRALGYTVQRVAGASRYDTSVALAREAIARAESPDQAVVFASGGDFPDALSAGALASGLDATLVLVPPRQLGPSADAFLRDHTERWTGGVVVGGPSAADEFVVEQIDAALRDAQAPTRAEPEVQQQSGDQVVGRFSGSASWYGAAFEGRRTASGETFRASELTAAHRTLAFGTRVRLTNPATGAQVIVRINDRGPYHGSRVIDVSRAAADRLGFTAQGTAWLDGEILA